MRQQVKIHTVKGNPSNPRLIKNDKFKKLVKSIKEFPEMLKLRPIVVDENMVVLGGNMRLKASKEAGLKEVWIDVAEGLTEEQKKEFIVKDNVGFGEWEWDILANEWDSVLLAEWGLDVWENKDDVDYSEKNKEIDIDALDSDMILKLKYTEDEYTLVREQLSKIASTPEQAVWKLLGNE
jgi:ParB-like chromosome segregation protein Spo0J